MSEYYSPNNLENICPYLTREPKWLVLGGPADAREAQAAKRQWSNIQVIGIEPNHEAREWQLHHLWPRDSYLLPYAISNEIGVAELVYETGRLRNASIDPDAIKGNRETLAKDSKLIFTTVQTRTLDWLDEIYGPFQDAIVWLDIEGSELKALQGAPNLITSGRVMLWNLEMLSRVPGLMEGIPKLLVGYKAVKDWNDSETCRDRIFIKG